jgi:hypothetical protein
MATLAAAISSQDFARFRFASGNVRAPRRQPLPVPAVETSAR